MSEQQTVQSPFTRNTTDNFTLPTRTCSQSATYRRRVMAASERSDDLDLVRDEMVSVTSALSHMSTSPTSAMSESGQSSAPDFNGVVIKIPHSGISVKLPNTFFDDKNFEIKVAGGRVSINAEEKKCEENPTKARCSDKIREDCAPTQKCKSGARKKSKGSSSRSSESSSSSSGSSESSSSSSGSSGSSSSSSGSWSSSGSSSDSDSYVTLTDSSTEDDTPPRNHRRCGNRRCKNCRRH